MKKILSIVLVMMLVFSFAACGGKEETPEVTTDPAVAGGWTTPEKLADAAIAEETVQVFTKACEKSGKQLTLAALLGTQVVAGTNYAFLCTEEGKTVIAIVYAGLDGEAEVLSVKPLDVATFTGSETATETEALAGGWTIGEDVTANNIGDEAQKALDTALAGFAGMNYEGIALLGTQVVAGVNYAILCKGTAVVPNAAASLYVVTVYAALDGTAEITSTAALNIADFTA